MMRKSLGPMVTQIQTEDLQDLQQILEILRETEQSETETEHSVTYQLQAQLIETLMLITTLSQIVEEKDERITSLTQQIKAKDDRIEQLEGTLRFYENPHVPPSLDKRSRKKKTAVKEEPALPKDAPRKDGRKRGQRKHPGTTRARPEPEDTIEVTAEECPKCGSTNIERQQQSVSKVVEEINQMLEYFAILYRR